MRTNYRSGSFEFYSYRDKRSITTSVETTALVIGDVEQGSPARGFRVEATRSERDALRKQWHRPI
jgi:hypothetical protein